MQVTMLSHWDSDFTNIGPHLTFPENANFFPYFFFSFIRWLSRAVLCNILCPRELSVSHVSPPDWRHSIGNCRVKSSCTHNEWRCHLLWLFTESWNDCLARLENRNKTQCFLLDSKPGRISMHLTSPERRSTSVDPQSGMERKSHLALWRSTGWLTPLLPEPDERGTSLLSSFSNSCLSAPFSLLTFPRHDECLGDIYVLLLFPLPAQCLTHLNKKRKDGHEMRCAPEGENDGGESNLERYCISSTVWLQEGFITGQAMVLQSCFRAPVSNWRVTLCLQCCSLHHSCGRQSAGRDFTAIWSISRAGTVYSYAYSTALKLFLQCTWA